MSGSAQQSLPDKRYFRIGEVCEITGLKPHVLRYWETEFKQVKPQKTKSNQRLYRKRDVETILRIKSLLYDHKFTIAGARAQLDDRKKADPKPERPRQLKIEFDAAGRDEMIDILTGELRAIKELLDT